MLLKALPRGERLPISPPYNPILSSVVSACMSFLDPDLEGLEEASTLPRQCGLA